MNFKSFTPCRFCMDVTLLSLPTCMCAQSHSHRKRTRRRTQASGCQVWHSSLNTSCHRSFWSGCPSLFYTVPHLVSLCVVFIHLHPYSLYLPLPLTSRLHGRIQKFFQCVVCWHPSGVNVTPTHLHQWGLACWQLPRHQPRSRRAVLIYYCSDEIIKESHMILQIDSVTERSGAGLPFIFHRVQKSRSHLTRTSHCFTAQRQWGVLVYFAFSPHALGPMNISINCMGDVNLWIGKENR